MDVTLGLRTVDTIRAELAELAPSEIRVAAPTVAAAAASAPAAGEALLATWAELLDAGRAQDGDENLAGTAKPARALLSAATAAAVGVADGDHVSLNTDSGVVVLPVVIDDLPDGVVWAPSNVAWRHRAHLAGRAPRLDRPADEKRCPAGDRARAVRR